MPNLTSLVDDHVTLKYECLDRIFLNGYVPKLQIPEDLSWFLCQHQGEEIPRYQLLGEMTVLRAVEALATQRGIPLVHFERGPRKEEIAAPYFGQRCHRRPEGQRSRVFARGWICRCKSRIAIRR